MSLRPRTGTRDDKPLQAFACRIYDISIPHTEVRGNNRRKHMRIGIGYDVHRLVEGRPLFIGGVEIPHTMGLQGHSDADVLIHAICDAILGALGEPDIGEYFPDTDPGNEGVPSTVFLNRVWEILDEKKMRINNLDSIIIADEPRIYPYKDRIKEVLSGILHIPAEALNLKGKTTEGTGMLGAGKAIAAQAVVTLVPEDAGQ